MHPRMRTTAAVLFFWGEMACLYAERKEPHRKGDVENVAACNHCFLIVTFLLNENHVDPLPNSPLKKKTYLTTPLNILFTFSFPSLEFLAWSSQLPGSHHIWLFLCTTL